MARRELPTDAQPVPAEPYFTVADLARRLGCSPKLIYRFCETRALRSIRTAGRSGTDRHARYRIALSDAERFVNSRTVAAEGSPQRKTAKGSALDESFVTMSDLARRLGCSPQVAYELCANRQIRHIRLSGASGSKRYARYRIRQSDAEAFIKSTTFATVAVPASQWPFVRQEPVRQDPKADGDQYGKVDEFPARSDFISATELARYLGCSTGTVHRLCGAREIRFMNTNSRPERHHGLHKCYRRYKILRSDAEKFIRSHTFPESDASAPPLVDLRGEPPEWVSVQDLAKRLGWHPSYVYEACLRNRELRHLRVGGSAGTGKMARYRMLPEDAEAFVRSLEQPDLISVVELAQYLGCGPLIIFRLCESKQVRFISTGAAPGSGDPDRYGRHKVFRSDAEQYVRSHTFPNTGRPAVELRGKPPVWLTPSELARLLGWKEREVLEACLREEVRHLRVGPDQANRLPHYRIRREDAEALIARQVAATK